MRNVLFIHTLAILLCTAMVGEIPLSYNDDISIEVDTEKEQEENSESEKEKTTGEDHAFLENEMLETKIKHATKHQEENWVTPSIDLHTPPPERN